MSKILESIGNAVHHATDNAHDLAAVTRSIAEEKLLDIPYVDLTIQVRACRPGGAHGHELMVS